MHVRLGVVAMTSSILDVIIMQRTSEIGGCQDQDVS
jgi:hypothetical protein